MTVLVDADRLIVRGRFSQRAGERREAIPLIKSDLLAAVIAVDNWLESNAASFNSALPQPARGALTARQKLELLYLVGLKRFEAN